MRFLFYLCLILGVDFCVLRVGYAQGLHDFHADVGLPCASCHIGEDVPADAPPNDICVACHGTMIEPLADGEVVSLPDPHRSPHLAPDEVPDCTTCHSIHGQPEFTCVMCHRSFETSLDGFGSNGEDPPSD